MSSGGDASFEAVPAARSRALKRRLRRRNQEARIRLRLLADASLLSGHHASQVPLVAAPASTGSAWRSPAAVTAFAEQVASLNAEVEGMRTAARTDEPAMRCPPSLGRSPAWAPRSTAWACSSRPPWRSSQLCASAGFEHQLILVPLAGRKNQLFLKAPDYTTSLVLHALATLTLLSRMLLALLTPVV